MAKLNKKSVKRGASIKGAPRKKTAEKLYLRRVMPIAYVIIFIGVCFGLYQLALPLLTKPVSRVSISGEFVQVDKNALASTVSPYLSKGFLLSDLSIIKEEIEKMPWVYQASVERQWPDQIAIHMVEQTPVARWGTQAYINIDGDVFSPVNAVSLAGLPKLDGPKSTSRDVMKKFRQLSEALLEQKLILNQLSLSEGHRWVGRLDSGITLVFGEEPVMEKLDRFIVAYRAELKKQFDQVAKIDMRYSNGLAVKWQVLPKKNTTKT